MVIYPVSCIEILVIDRLGNITSNTGSSFNNDGWECNRVSIPECTQSDANNGICLLDPEPLVSLEELLDGVEILEEPVDYVLPTLFQASTFCEARAYVPYYANATQHGYIDSLGELPYWVAVTEGYFADANLSNICTYNLGKGDFGTAKMN